MSNFIISIISLSITTTLIYLLFELIKKINQRNISYQWFYYMWIIIGIRFVVPTPHNLNFTQYIFRKAWEFFGKEDMWIFTTGVKSNHVVFTILGLIWITGVIGVSIYKVSTYIQFKKYLAATNIVVDDIEVLDILATEMEHYHIKQQVQLLENPIISSPILVRLKQWTIIVPSIAIPKIELQNILRHELVHLKRHDILFLRCIVFVTTIHWFNPIVYQMKNKFLEDCELSCDETVIKEYSKEQRISYGETLLSSISNLGNYQEKKVVLSLNENARSLKKRLQFIAEHQQFKHSMYKAILLTIGFALFSMVLGQIQVPDFYLQTTTTGNASEKKPLEDVDKLEIQGTDAIITFVKSEENYIASNTPIDIKNSGSNTKINLENAEEVEVGVKDTNTFKEIVLTLNGGDIQIEDIKVDNFYIKNELASILIDTMKVNGNLTIDTNLGEVTAKKLNIAETFKVKANMDVMSLEQVVATSIDMELEATDMVLQSFMVSGVTKVKTNSSFEMRDSTLKDIQLEQAYRPTVVSKVICDNLFFIGTGSSHITYNGEGCNVKADLYDFSKATLNFQDTKELYSISGIKDEKVLENELKVDEKEEQYPYQYTGVNVHYNVEIHVKDYLTGGVSMKFDSN